MRVLFIGSSGGHLVQLHNLKPWWERHDRLGVTFEKLDSKSLLAGESVTWAHHPTTRNQRTGPRTLPWPGGCCAPPSRTSSPAAPRCPSRSSCWPGSSSVGCCD